METYLTKFEVSRIVGMRALQLSEGAAPTLSVGGDDVIRTAATELYRGTLDVVVLRDGKEPVPLLGRRVRSPALDSFLSTFSACGRTGGPEKYADEAS